QRLYNLLGTTDDVVEGLKSIVLDKAMNDVRTLTHFNAIKECLKSEAPPEYETVHLMVKDPWLIVSDSLQCSQDEMNDLVFKQMIEISKPEELMESFGLVEGAELTDEKIAHVIANTISTSIYIYIVKSIYYQIQNSNVFRHVLNEADHFDEYFVNKLSQVTLATGEQLVRDLFSEAS
ncbi:MAG: hypothetical protein KC493_16530, partial [Bacteriovoracaceae bacterium]|nr:hypothetical protein [Bacteriovoracaceae bacterium]